uniref:Putative nuclease HARBI1 n=1 Tax=Gasterosteus aculeatus aculeatus TaxID=481459 RepID=G3PMN0_GASAC
FCPFSLFLQKCLVIIIFDSQRHSEMSGVVHRHHHFARRGYRQRVYVERTKPLEQYTPEELYVRLRFGKADMEYLVNLLRPKLQHRTQRSHSLSVEDQILIALRFYACGTFYQVVGDYMGVVKSAVCDVVRDVSIVLASLVNEFVSFPKDNQISFGEYAQYYWKADKVSSCWSSIDCTHFINRKGRHSINVQLVCDADLIITNCVVKWPGSVHDARILRESALYRDLQTNRPDGIILGDSAYPLLPWLMTPFLTANTLAQARFNTAHCRARCAIERLNGVLRRRFACLNYLRAEPQKACNITLACIVLHNIATKRNAPLCADNDAPEPLGDPNQPPAFCQNEQTGRATRDAIATVIR